MFSSFHLFSSVPHTVRHAIMRRGTEIIFGKGAKEEEEKRESELEKRQRLLAGCLIFQIRKERRRLGFLAIDPI